MSNLGDSKFKYFIYYNTKSTNCIRVNFFGLLKKLRFIYATRMAITNCSKHEIKCNISQIKEKVLSSEKTRIIFIN